MFGCLSKDRNELKKRFFDEDSEAILNSGNQGQFDFSFYEIFERKMLDFLGQLDIGLLISDILFNTKESSISNKILNILILNYFGVPKEPQISKWIKSPFFNFGKRGNNNEDGTNAKAAYYSYRGFNVKLFVLDTLGNFTFKFIDKIKENTVVNRNAKNFDSLSVVFYFLIFSKADLIKKCELLFDLLDYESKGYISSGGKSLYIILRKFILVQLFAGDACLNNYISEMKRDYKDHFDIINSNSQIETAINEDLEEIQILKNINYFTIIYKKALLFLKETKGVLKDFVIYISHNFIFFERRTNQKMDKGKFLQLMMYKKFQILHPTCIKSYLIKYMQVNRERTSLFITNIPKMINFYQKNSKRKEGRVEGINYDNLVELDLADDYVKYQNIFKHEGNYLFIAESLREKNKYLDLFEDQKAKKKKTTRHNTIRSNIDTSEDDLFSPTVVKHDNLKRSSNTLKFDSLKKIKHNSTLFKYSPNREGKEDPQKEDIQANLKDEMNNVINNFDIKLKQSPDKEEDNLNPDPPMRVKSSSSGDIKKSQKMIRFGNLSSKNNIPTGGNNENSKKIFDLNPIEEFEDHEDLFTNRYKRTSEEKEDKEILVEKDLDNAEKGLNNYNSSDSSINEKENGLEEKKIVEEEIYNEEKSYENSKINKNDENDHQYSENQSKQMSEKQYNLNIQNFSDGSDEEQGENVPSNNNSQDNSNFEVLESQATSVRPGHTRTYKVNIQNFSEEEEDAIDIDMPPLNDHNHIEDPNLEKEENKIQLESDSKSESKYECKSVSENEAQNESEIRFKSKNINRKIKPLSQKSIEDESNNNNVKEEIRVSNAIDTKQEKKISTYSDLSDFRDTLNSKIFKPGKFNISEKLKTEEFSGIDNDFLNNTEDENSMLVYLERYTNQNGNDNIANNINFASLINISGGERESENDIKMRFTLAKGGILNSEQNNENRNNNENSEENKESSLNIDSLNINFDLLFNNYFKSFFKLDSVEKTKIKLFKLTKKMEKKVKLLSEKYKNEMFTYSKEELFEILDNKVSPNLINFYMRLLNNYNSFLVNKRLINTRVKFVDCDFFNILQDNYISEGDFDLILKNYNSVLFKNNEFVININSKETSNVLIVPIYVENLQIGTNNLFLAKFEFANKKIVMYDTNDILYKDQSITSNYKIIFETFFAYLIKNNLISSEYSNWDIVVDLNCACYMDEDYPIIVLLNVAESFCKDEEVDFDNEVLYDQWKERVFLHLAEFYLKIAEAE